MLGRVFYVFLSKWGFSWTADASVSVYKPNNLKKEFQMNRMNRREFISVLGGASALTMAIPAFASTTADKIATDITSLYVKGLVMVDLGNPDIIRLGFPKAPGHKATLSVVPQSGIKR